MFVKYGLYRFSPTKVAFRSDFCLRCEQPTVAIATRTFDVGHVFWIPLLPLGFWRRWRCRRCDQPPHRMARVRRTSKALSAILLGLIAVISWFLPRGPEGEQLEIGPMWVLRVVSLAGFLALTWSAARSPPDESYRRRRSEVPPLVGGRCPLCDGVMTSGTRWRCESCGMDRL